MAKRPYYYVKNGKVCEANAEFKWISGLSVSQKMKNVKSLHSSIPMRALEVSTKSEEVIGKKLSAFSLTYGDGIKASKVFEKGGPFLDLALRSPKEAKHDLRLKESGAIRGFMDFDENQKWTLDEPYYDYLYVKTALKNLSDEELEQIASYDAFTDIEFNPAKARNTQARSVAVLKLFYQMFGRAKLNKKDFVVFEKMFVSI